MMVKSIMFFASFFGVLGYTQGALAEDYAKGMIPQKAIDAYSTDLVKSGLLELDAYPLDIVKKLNSYEIVFRLTVIQEYSPFSLVVVKNQNGWFVSKRELGEAKINISSVRVSRTVISEDDFKSIQENFESAIRRVAMISNERSKVENSALRKSAVVEMLKDGQYLAGVVFPVGIKEFEVIFKEEFSLLDDLGNGVRRTISN